jgi:hypothetical protein
MNLNLIAYPGFAKQVAEAHIEQRIQVPHVPLKFNSETQDVELIAVIADPIDSIKNTEDESKVTEAIDLYNKTLEDSISAKFVYHSDDVIQKTDAFILDLFDKMNLDEENYKTKTGSASLREDVANKKVVVEETRTIQTFIDTNNFNLERSWELYNTLVEKVIKLDA